MSPSTPFRHAGSRIGTFGFRVGALALLFYGASFYTRDWRSAVPEMGQPGQAQAASRSMASQPAWVDPSKPSSAIEPTMTGALPRTVEAAPETATPQASASSREKTKPAVPRSPARHEQTKRTQTAAASKAKQSSPVDLPASVPETPVEFRLAERSN